MFCVFFVFFIYIRIICQTPKKILDCKIKVTINRNFNLWYFTFVLEWAMFPILITQFGSLTNPNTNPFSFIIGVEILTLNSVRI